VLGKAVEADPVRFSKLPHPGDNWALYLRALNGIVMLRPNFAGVGFDLNKAIELWLKDKTEAP
jgi:hypothetical protein